MATPRKKDRADEDPRLHAPWITWLRAQVELQRVAFFSVRHDHAGTYVNLTTSATIKSLATRRSRGRGPAKNGLPPPSTTGWM